MQNLHVHSWGTRVCWQLRPLPPGLQVCGPPTCWCRPSVPAQVPAQTPARPAEARVRTPAARACGLPREGQEPWGFPSAARSLSTVPGSPAVHAGAGRRTENGCGHGSPAKKKCGRRGRRTQDAITTHPHMENLKAEPERKSCVSLCDSLWPLRCNKQKTVHTWAYVPQANCSHKANRNFFRILQWTIEGK